MNYAKMTEEQIRKAYSGFIPPMVRAQMSANREPTEAEIEAARALIAKVEGPKRRPRALEAAE
jgi:hypothetical protein